MGYQECQKLHSLITRSPTFFSAASSLTHQSNRPIRQLPVQSSAESANEWVLEDLPAGPSMITQAPLPGQLPHSSHIASERVGELSGQTYSIHVCFFSWFKVLMHGE